MLRPILLDLDGTLLDTLGDLADAANAARAALGLLPVPDGIVAPHIGWGLGHLLRNVLPPGLHGQLATARAAFMAYYGAHLLVRSVPYPGADALVRTRGRRFLGLVTNKPMVFVEPILRGLDWDFDRVVAGDTLAQRKPDPRPLTYALRDVVGAADAVFVGDTEVDEDAAAAADIEFLAVSWGRVASLGRPRIERLDALLDLEGGLPC